MDYTASSTASGLPWQLRQEDGRAVLAIAQQHGISELLAGILVGRQVAVDAVPNFLNPTLREYLPDPFHLRDMDKAAARILTAIHAGEHIAIFGDYDVDGATSTAVLLHYFSALGLTAQPYIPDRMAEGYGPNIPAFERLIDQGATLIITVDCGTMAHDPIAYAQGRGVDVIVLDHHTSSGALPPALAIVNPNRVDETSPLTNLAAVGVTFLTLVAVNKLLKEGAREEVDERYKIIDASGQGSVSSNQSSAQPIGSCLNSPLAGESESATRDPVGGRYEILDGSKEAPHGCARAHPAPPQGGSWELGAAVQAQTNTQPSLLATPPSLLPLLDLVALGTVCDVMQLTGLNRAFVAQGLKIMAQRRNLGLTLLSDIARMEEAPNTYHLGFLLGPRINAGGRVGKSSLGVELLTARDAEQAQPLAEQLDLHNNERQAIEAGVLEQAMALAAQQSNLPILLVAQEGWHQGVIGIVAGRLKEKFNRPAIVVALENGIGKASGRSVAGVDLGAAVHTGVTQGLILSGGGHAMAAGFSVEVTQLNALHDFLIQRLEGAVNAYSEARTQRYDGLLSVSGATLDTLDDIARAGPYGMGNPAPRFVIPAATIAHVAIMKEKHLRVTLADHSGTARLNAVAFGAVGTKLGTWLLAEKKLHLLGSLKRNSWQGKDSAQFLIDDAARVG